MEHYGKVLFFRYERCICEKKYKGIKRERTRKTKGWKVTTRYLYIKMRVNLKDFFRNGIVFGSRSVRLAAAFSYKREICCFTTYVTE